MSPFPYILTHIQFKNHIVNNCPNNITKKIYCVIPSHFASMLSLSVYRRPERNPIRDDLSSSVGSSLFEFSLPNKQYSMSPSLLNSSGLNEINRLRDELVNQTSKQMQWEDRILQASKACEAWKSEADESNRKVCGSLLIS